MKLIGICNDETASACLMVDGEVICAASEERFTRIKFDSSFPLNAINFCLDYYNITLADIDVVTYAWTKGFDPNLLQNYLSLGAQYVNEPDALAIMSDRIKWEIDRDKQNRKEFDQWVSGNIDKNNQKVLDYYHHEAHAASAALVSPFDDGYVLTSDGRGDFEATTIYKFTRNSSQQLKKLYSSTSVQSFGFYYGRITGLLGFKPMRHEGKVTGLAAYGDSRDTLALCKKMMEVIDGDIVPHLGDYYRPYFAPYSDRLESEIAKYARQDVAAAAQDHLETMMTELLASHLITEDVTDINLMCAGGVFSNVKVTQRLKEMPAVSNVYVQPQMGDGGLCIGACALANESLAGSDANEGRLTKELQTMYLGPIAQFRDRTFENRATDYLCLPYTFTDAVEAFVQSLKKGHVVGLINGRMEFGPRALGNRSIIVNTSDRSINEWLNTRLRRNEFMPFAPVLRAEIAGSCIKDYNSDDVTLRFMTSTVECTEEFEERNPAVVHVDHTARPQIVTKMSNKFLWSVLKRWETISLQSSLVNTSFNVHEEPIVCDVDEGFESLDTGVIDELWVVTSKEAHCFSVK